MSEETEWEVLHYDPIERLESNLWVVEGDLPNMGLRRRMAILKRSDGRLVIHNGIALHEDDMEEVEKWGEPAVLLVPNAYHRLDAAAYKSRYPELQVYCPKGATAKVQEKVEVDGHYDDFPRDLRVELGHLAGLKEAEGYALIYHGPAKDRCTLVLNDSIFNQPHLSGMQGLIMRLLGSTGSARVTRIFRWLVLKDKEAFRQHMLQLSQTPGLCRVIMSHGQVLEEEAAQTLRHVIQKL